MNVVVVDGGDRDGIPLVELKIRLY